MKYLYIILLSLLFTASLYAKNTVSSLTPHYMYQFANNIHKTNSNNFYRIHIISNNPKEKKNFENILKNKKVRGKKFLISYSKGFNVPKSTNMLYLSGNSNISLSQVSSYVEGKSILLISFNQKDKKRVMINLFTTKSNKLSFEINRANILNEGFSISDKVVLMGGTELDVAKLFKGAKESLRLKEKEFEKSQKKIDKFYKQIKILEAEYKSKSLTLKSTRDALKKFNEDSKKLKKRLKKENALHKKQVLTNKKLQIQLLKTTDARNAMQNKLTLTLQEIQQRENALVKLNTTILSKEKELLKLNKVTLTQDEQIKNQEGTIDTQENILILTIGILVIFMVFVVLIVLLYKKQQKISQELTLTLTELEETQEELIQSAKMASLGELVSGLAHEMNTPIGVAITGVSVLQNTRGELEAKLTGKKLKESDLVSFFSLTNKLSESINVSLQKAAQLIRSFKQVSVDQQVEVLREFNLKEYLDTILISLKPQFKHSGIQIKLEIDNNIFLNSYPGIYYQILTNLINNSILHGFEGEEEGTITVQASIKDDRLHLVYRDDGKGVNEENISHIFEPFFTTKRANGGTGLGLHIIYNLITQKLRGNIQASSKEGEGLTLSMSFPLVVD
ncbi:DUF4154 domain-containing protein [Sulfurimonas sp. SAG-AH-194-C21]|nr:YfiR/HmsC family protein [Sulfurimonas sp. SAG-AH-194-C21]MDF1883981.1 DUF4154 domain-containing protein [Sulfurimonas sp. SAG-AH-194-C21]